MRQHQQQYQPTIADDLLLKRMRIEGILTPKDTVLRTAYRALAADYEDRSRMVEEAALRSQCIEADRDRIKVLEAVVVERDQDIADLKAERWSLVGLCGVLSAMVLCLAWALSVVVER